VARDSGQRSLSLRTRRHGCETCRNLLLTFQPLRGLTPHI